MNRDASDFFFRHANSSIPTDFVSFFSETVKQRVYNGLVMHQMSSCCKMRNWFKIINISSTSHLTSTSISTSTSASASTQQLISEWEGIQHKKSSSCASTWAVQTRAPAENRISTRLFCAMACHTVAERRDRGTVRAGAHWWWGRSHTQTLVTASGATCRESDGGVKKGCTPKCTVMSGVSVPLPCACTCLRLDVQTLRL